MSLRQSDIARLVGTGDMDVSRIVSALCIESRPLVDFDALRILTVIEARDLGMTTPVACELVLGLHAEMRHCSMCPDRRCWVVFCRRDGEPEFHMSCTSQRHLEAVLATFPLSLVLPLHEIVARAKERLTALKTRKDAT